MNDTLNQYGYGFQVKILSSLISDRNFISQTIDLLDTSYFDNESLKWLAQRILDYFKEYRVLPTLEVFKVQISNLQQDSLFKTEVVNSLREVWKGLESVDLEYIKKTTVDFCKNQELKKAIITSVDLLKLGKYDEIKSAIDAALKRGMNDNLGLDYLLDIESRYSKAEELKRISTGWSVIDDLMGGGLPLGKFGLIMGGLGSGKSFSLVHLGAHALKLGYNVLHYTLELDQNYVAWRYDSTLTGIGLDDLRFHLPDIKKRLGKYEGQLLIKEYPTKSISLNGIRSHCDKVQMLGKKPSIIIMDYLDLLKMNSKRDARKDEELEELYEEFRGFCGEYHLAGWSATQSNRTGSEKDAVGAESVASSYAKGFVADFWMSLSRRTKDKISSTARWNIIKNRFGPDGMVLPSKFDTSRGLIEIYNEKSEGGKKVKEQMVADARYDMEYGAKQFERILNNNRKEPTDLF